MWCPGWKLEGRERLPLPITPIIYSSRLLVVHIVFSVPPNIYDVSRPQWKKVYSQVEVG